MQTGGRLCRVSIPLYRFFDNLILILETLARISQVAQFLSGGGLVNAKTNENPHLFCSDGFAEEVDRAWNEFARDANGDYMITERDSNGKVKSGYTIVDVYPHIRAQSSSALPWWVDELKGYTFSTGLIEALCDKEGREAMTSRADAYPSVEAGSPLGFTYANFNRHILLCPSSFSPAEGMSHGRETLAGLVTSDKYPPVGDQRFIDQFGTISCTLYHELYHMVDSTGSDSDGPVTTSSDSEEKIQCLRPLHLPLPFSSPRRANLIIQGIKRRKLSMLTLQTNQALSMPRSHTSFSRWRLTCTRIRLPVHRRVCTW
jgi:hypothetical protein